MSVVEPTTSLRSQQAFPGLTPTSDAAFRQLVHELPDAILVHSQDRIVFVNPACVKMLGAEHPEQLIGRNISDFIHNDSLAAIQRRIRDCYQRQGNNPAMENVLVTLDGSRIPTEATAIFLTWEGQPAIEVVLRDISKRKRAEEKLRQYERVVEGLAEMIVVVDREFRYVLANRAFLAYRNMQKDDIVGRRVSDIVDRQVFEVELKPRLEECFTGKVVKFEMKYEYPNLGERSLSVSYFPVREPGGVTGAACVLQDVTASKRMEEANQAWQKRLELAEKAGLRIGLWDWDVAANTVVWSEETYRQFGFTRETFSGEVELAIKRLHPDDRLRVEQAISPVLAGEANEYAAQYRVVRPDGSICWIDAHGVMVRNGSSHMMGIGVDITDLKRAEQTLQESEENYRLLLNSTAEAIYGLDLQGNCTFCNPACLDQLGYSTPEDLLGKNMHRLMHHTRADGRPYPEQECEIYVAIRERRGSHVSSEVLWRANGTSFPAEYWSYPMYKGGEIVGAVVAFLDISERKRAEEALARSEEKYRALFENATHGIFRATRDGRLLDVNPALVNILGYSSREELLTRNLNTDIYQDASARMALLDSCERAGRVDGAELTWKRKDGKLRVVRLSGRLFRDPEGSVTHYEVMVEDVTQQRSLEEQFRQSQKMEAIGLLAGGISHDFNNLLGVILGNADLLLQKDEPEAQQHYAEEIKKATQRAAQLTRQLLAFSRKQVLYPTLLDLNAVISDVGKMLRRVIGEDVEIITEFAPGLGSIRADRGQIEQILMNLAANARDAMPNGGKFRLRTENSQLGACDQALHPYVQPGRYVRLSVNDTGTGMSEEVRARVFEPFFTTKPQGRGTGLGLATVYGIVKQSGGFIWLTSVPGAGTTFDIYLPFVGERAVSLVSDVAARSEFPTGTGTILLVEDEDSLREVTYLVLTSAGYNVMQAGRGDLAIDLAEQYKGAIDLVISDVVLPDRSGPSVVAKVRALHPEIQVFYVSGFAEVPVAQQLVNEGAVLLQKPVSRRDLLQKVAEMLRERPKTVIPVEAACEQTSTAHDKA